MSNNALMNKPASSQSNSGKMSLQDFYRTGISLSKLKDGEYEATLQAHALVEPTTPEAKPYVRLELKLADRVIVDNRFEAGLPVALDQIKEQLGKSEEAISVLELLDYLKTTTFKIWISYATLDGKTYRNVNYIAPRQDQPTDTSGQAEVKDGEDF